MEDCLDIIMFNAHEQNLFSISDLAKLKRVSKEFESQATYYIQKKHETYNKRPVREGCQRYAVRIPKHQCGYCNENWTHFAYPFATRIACYLCRNHIEICKTDAKRKYKLINTDLQDLDYIISYHTFYGTEMTYYSTKQVVEQSIFKHGEVPKKREGSAAKEKRIQQVGKLVLLHGDRKEIQDYIRNGKGGIRKLVKSLAMDVKTLQSS